MCGTRNSSPSGKIIVLFVICCLVIGGFVVNTALALSGSGTQQDPWRIKSLDDFNDFAADANYWAGFTRLETDVNLAGRTYTTAVIAPDTNNSDYDYDFDGTAFTGVFDGNDHRLINLTIDDGGAGHWYLGLFGYVDEGELRNLGLEGCSLSGTGYYVGALVGENWYGSISCCHSTGDVSGYRYVGGLAGENYSGDIWNCYSTVDVNGDAWVGGLVGYNNGSIEESYARGDVSGWFYVGGLVGYNEDSIECAYASGTVSGCWYIGGLAGKSYCSIEESYSIGEVNGVNYVGGFIGAGYPVNRCFWDVETSGINYSEAGRGLSTAQMQTISTYSLNDWEGDTWTMIEGQYPRLAWENAGGGYIPEPFIELSGSGTAEEPYRIIDVNDLLFVGFSSSIWDKQFILESDLDVQGISIYRIGNNIGWSFSGVFDGNNHLISNLRIDAQEAHYVALFGSLAREGVIKDLTLENVYIRGCHTVACLLGFSSGTVSNCHASGTVSGKYCVAGLIERNYYGTVSNCSMTGLVSGYSNVGGLVGTSEGTIKQSHTNAYVTGQIIDVGGLVGENIGSVSDCSSIGSVCCNDRYAGGLVGHNHGDVSNCYSTCDVNGVDYVGGLVGYNDYGIVLNCSSTGNVNGADFVGGLVGSSGGGVSNCYSTGDVLSGNRYVGGLVGENWSCVTNCYAQGDVNGVDSVGGLVGFNGCVHWYWIWSGVSNCYSTGDVSGMEAVGGLVGGNNGSVYNCFWDVNTQHNGVTESFGHNNMPGTVVEGLTTAQMQTKNTFTDAGWDFMGERPNGTCETWHMLAAGGYPVLSFFHASIPFNLVGDGNADDPYLIADANDLGMVNWHPTNRYFRLTCDIDLSGVYWSVPVVPVFNGRFDGSGYKLVNTLISGGSWLAPFGYLGGDGHLVNLGLEGGHVSVYRYNYYGFCYCYAGGLLGESWGIVSNCYSTINVIGGKNVGGLVGQNMSSVFNCYSTGDVLSGNRYVGGLVGDNCGNVSNCYAAGDVSGYYDVGGLVGDNSDNVSNCYSTGDVNGLDIIGGLMGDNSGNVSNCYSNGDVNGVEEVGGLVGQNMSSVSNCYSTGNVNGLDYVGGLLGKNYFEGSVSNSFWDNEIQTHGVTESIGLNEGNVNNVEGFPTTQMQTRSTFTDAGWDFVGETNNGTEDIWTIHEGVDYPKFVWELVNFIGWYEVDSLDFSFFANRWQDNNCGLTNDCDGADLDFSDNVDLADLKIFADHWLEGVE